MIERDPEKKDDLNKELERRDHAFCRYAADCNINVGSQRAGRRLMESVTQFLKATLKLKVNPTKRAVERPWRRKFLGFSLSRQKVSRMRVAPESVKRFQDKVRMKFRSGRGRNLQVFLTQDLRPLLRGWANTSSWRKLDVCLKNSTNGCGGSSAAWNGGNGNEGARVIESCWRLGLPKPRHWPVRSTGVDRGGMRVHNTFARRCRPRTFAVSDWCH